MKMMMLMIVIMKELKQNNATAIKNVSQTVMAF